MWRVDRMPRWARPFLWIYGLSLGSLGYAMIYLLHRSCRIKCEGFPALKKDQRNYIFCYWHHNLMPWFVTFARHPKAQVWLNHPLWYMKPIHFILRFMGIEKLILGSTGHDGRKAAERLEAVLKNGYSTTVAVDGPGGPPQVLKKGCLHMAKNTGIPLIPVTIKVSREIHLSHTWDGKRIPLPFADITVVFGEPIEVTEQNFNLAYEKLQRALRCDAGPGVRTIFAQEPGG